MTDTAKKFGEKHENKAIKIFVYYFNRYDSWCLHFTVVFSGIYGKKFVIPSAHWLAKRNRVLEHCDYCYAKRETIKIIIVTIENPSVFQYL